MALTAPTISRVTLPCGSVFDLARPRSSGPLRPNERDWCVSNNIPLAFDPAQIGWVVAGCEDDIDLPRRAPTRQTRAARDRFRAQGAGDSDLTLRVWTDADAEGYAALLSDPTVWSYLYEDYPGTIDADMAQTLIDLANSRNHHEVRAVLHHDIPVGQVRLEFATDPTRQDKAELSYWLGRAHWGQGLGSRFVADYTCRSFAAHPELDHIVARVHRHNPASARVLTKAGYAALGADLALPEWDMFRISR